MSEQHVADAMASIADDEIERLLVEMVRTSSPTGAEEALASQLQARLEADGLASRYQPVGLGRGNTVAHIAGSEDGPHLLLYASIDTHATGRAEDDSLGVLPAPDLELEPAVSDGQVVGLGAQNPKAFAACVAIALMAVGRARIPLRGKVTAGLVAGGNPDIGEPPGDTASMGFGVGGAALLDEIEPDHAVIAKGSWTISRIEPGVCWVKVTVHGLPGYAGTRHLAPYRNAVVDAARVIEHLEAWFPAYATNHARDGVTPQAIVGAVRGGWPRKPAFVPEVCEIFVDLRVAPGDEPSVAHAALEASLAELRDADPELRVTSETVAAYAPQTTAEDAWIIGAAVRAWEATEGRPHQAKSAAAGVTDALILREAGIPTAKVGLPKGAAPPAGLERFTMGVVDIASMRKLVELLVRVIVETVTSGDAPRRSA